MSTLRLFLVAGLLALLPITSLPAQEMGVPTATIRVDGLSCPFCAYGLEKHLKKVTGVENVKIDMKGGKAVVHLRPGIHVDDAALREAVKKAGFTPREITRP